MAFYKILTGSSFYKLASSEASKSFYENLGYTSSSISDTEANGLRKETYNINQDNSITANSAVDVDISQSEIQEKLNAHISFVESVIGQHESPPIEWSDGLSTLKSIDISGLTYPIQAVNWIGALEKNSITVPLILEL